MIVLPHGKSDLDEALWALRCVPGHKREKRLLAVAFGERMLRYTDDPRCSYAVETACLFAHGEATASELRSAAMAAEAAGNDIYRVKKTRAYAAWAIANACAKSSFRAAWTASKSAVEAAWDQNAERSAQAKIFRRIFR